ncbi:torsin-4A-B-like [Carcharodon carcharias]|uniref:torsin-4A-B-like n=1 Tax=Carcharodon carcharias TaxID=13397 RepID=UPI001B7F4772|nr:torsin-4A-B-like [Carcharodon carcharias]XP_041068857.1 torsin-4A-B-like [Carcharodon carcharias]XP_041068858.1 torsin-4A-B-like [Carcharodon carcharias]XP_041068859.1 torsin-4A-B-like [Carcharodon carcharias]
MEVPKMKTTPNNRLLHLTAKIRMANRMLRGKCNRKAAPTRSTIGYFAAANCHPPLKRKGTIRKLHGKKKPLPLRSKSWWSTDTETKAKYLLFLLCLIVGFQVYNAYENLDDNLLIYDIDQLEKTLHRELLGQTLALNKLTKLLRNYFATFVHEKPLFLSINGPAGVGKSHLGRLIAKHFKFQLGPQLVLQHSVRYQQLVGHSDHRSELAARISAIFSEALRTQRIPVLLFDEMELAPAELLSYVRDLLHSEHTSAVYIFVSKLGQEWIMQSLRHSLVHKATRRVAKLSRELAQLFAWRHPVWQVPEIIPLCPLERAHVVQCFHQLMDQEGLFPRERQVETMANRMNYYRAKQKLYAQQGCKRVLSMVKQLTEQKRLEDLKNEKVLQRHKHHGVYSEEILSIFNHPLMHY